MDLAYGLIPGFELDVVLSVNHADDSRKASLGYNATLLLLGFKWQLVAHERWTVAVTPAGGLDLDDLDNATGFVPVEVEYRPDRWRLGGEAGYVPQQGGPDGWQAGAYAARGFDAGSELMGEIWCAALRDVDDPSVNWQLGVDWAAEPWLHVLAAGGTGTVGGGGGPRRGWTAYLGVQLLVHPFDP